MLEAIVERMLDKYVDVNFSLIIGKSLWACGSFLTIHSLRCIEHGEYQQAVGTAIECRRIDKLVEAIERSDIVHGTLSYCINACHSFIDHKEYRLEVFRHIVNVHQELHHPDLLSICQYLMLLDEPEGVASILEKLLRSKNKDRALVAFQIAFDLVENEDQTFLLYARDLFSMCQPSDSTQNDHATDPREGMYAERLTKIRRIFVWRGINRIDPTFFIQSYLLIPKTIKQPIEKSGSVCHNATLYANAIMHAGTAVDTFVRENLDLLRKRGNWAQFSAIAGLGVIYRDNREQLQLQQGESQMSPYVFESPSGVSCIAYTKGGALCAVDLYYANHGEEIKQCIRDSLRGTNVEVVQHGACLGLGLAALGTAGENIYDDIKNVLHADSAVAGEAAGLQAICLLVLVRHNMRRLLALTVYGREEEADTN